MVAIASADEDFVEPEGILALADNFASEHLEHRGVEALRGRKIAGDLLDVIDEPAAMQLLCLHRLDQ